MSIVVDSLTDNGWRLGPNAHMLSTRSGKAGTAELMAFAVRIGMRRIWIQRPGEPAEHFDLTAKRHAWALENGARLVDKRELVAIIRAKRSQEAA